MALSSGNDREITNRIAERVTAANRLGPKELSCVLSGDYEQASPVLRNPVLEAIDNAGRHGVTKIPERFKEPHQDGPVIPHGQLWNVLDQNHARVETFNHCYEAAPEQSAVILNSSSSAANEITQLRLTRPRERLTRNASCHKVNAVDPPAVEMLKEVRWVGEIAGVAQSPHAGGMGFDGPLIVISTNQNREARLLQAQTETAGTTEEINCARSPLSPEPILNRT